MNRIIVTEHVDECRWKRFTVPAHRPEPHLPYNARRLVSLVVVQAPGRGRDARSRPSHAKSRMTERLTDRKTQPLPQPGAERHQAAPRRQCQTGRCGRSSSRWEKMAGRGGVKTGQNACNSEDLKLLYKRPLMHRRIAVNLFAIEFSAASTA